MIRALSPSGFARVHPTRGGYLRTRGYTGHLQARGSLAMRRQEDPPRLPSSPSMPQPAHDITSTLYQELHRLAAGKMRFERGDHTLQPTALVNEAYLRLVNCSDFMWQDRTPRLG